MVAQLETSTLNCEHRLPDTVAGLVQVFTRPDRSFFTNVMAQALVIASQGTPVLAIQFLKGGINQGEDRPVRLVQHLDWIRCNLPRCIDTPHLDDGEMRSLHQLWQYTQQVVFEGKYSLVVLDELSLAINLGLIPLDEVLAFLQKRPPHVDFILTGPDMPQAIINVADQITEIRRSHYP